MDLSFTNVNQAFSKQSAQFDFDDRANPILTDLRAKVYSHVEKFLEPNSHILELNAGTGIDATHFVTKGHAVHATDLSDGMIYQIKEKSRIGNLSALTCQQVSFDRLDEISAGKFDYVFSNFGGLNCIDDLSKVTQHLPALLVPGAYVTWVIMPPVCLWEMASLFKGNKNAFRRLNPDGVMAHLEGHYFKTYYHSLKKIKAAFGPSFHFITSEGLAALTPPPHATSFVSKFPRTYSLLRKVDNMVKNFLPFNRWADHIIVTFQYLGE